MSKRNVHTALLKAAANGTGIRLTAQEVLVLAMDEGVKQAGLSTLHAGVRGRIEGQVPSGYLNPRAWQGVKP